jgi:hypothetical protein
MIDLGGSDDSLPGTSRSWSIRWTVGHGVTPGAVPRLTDDARAATAATTGNGSVPRLPSKAVLHGRHFLTPSRLAMGDATGRSGQLHSTMMLRTDSRPRSGEQHHPHQSATSEGNEP